MPALSITYLPVGKLRLYANHAHKHPKAKISKLAKLMREYGMIVPILIDKNLEIIAGHARYLAAIELDIKKVPVLQIEHLNDAQLSGFRIADNKITEGSEWDFEILKNEFQTLIDIDFDIQLTAFEVAEVDMVILGDSGPDDEAPSENIPIPPESPIVQPGDIFKLGQNRVICGDCLDWTVMESLMNGNLADMVITDPPYNVKINGHVLTQKEVHSEFSMASGEMSKDEYCTFLTKTAQNLKRASRSGSLHYHFIDHRHLDEMLASGDQIYDERLNICVWVKTNAGMGSLYRSQHEFCCVFKHGKASHVNNVQLGKFGRSRTNVWSYQGMNTFCANRDELLASHPTVKNTQMIADAILDVTKRKDIVLDAFLGSGTTIVAAESTGRICYGIEIEPRYVEVCIERFRSVSSEPVIHIESGQTFDELKKSRQGQSKLEVVSHGQ